MQLASEDALKLSVLVATAEAVRIDEARMCVFGLKGDDTARVELHPTGTHEQYLRCVRSFLTGAAPASRAGYPLHLKAWTRLGELNNADPAALLMLGEEEAAVAASRTPNLSDDMARRIWWVVSTAEVARFLLANPRVTQGRMGRVLVDHLLEYLPFETAPIAAIESIGLVLESGLLDAAEVMRLWHTARRRSHYYIGFLRARPRCLPEPGAAHPGYTELAHRVDAPENPFARELLHLLSGNGQAFLGACAQVLARAADQDVVVALLDAMSAHFKPLRVLDGAWTGIEELEVFVTKLRVDPARFSTPLAALLRDVPDYATEITALLTLAHADERLVRHLFARTDAVGSVMRDKIAPLTAPLLNCLYALQAR